MTRKAAMTAINRMRNYFEERLITIVITTKNGEKYGLGSDSIDWEEGFMGLAMDDSYTAIAYDNIASITA